MKNLKISLAGLLLMSFSVFASDMNDDPLLTKVMGEVEIHDIKNGDAPIILDIEAWAGFDLNKLWLKTDIKKSGNQIEDQEVQLLYSRAVYPFWDLQIGARKDFKPDAFQREWFVVGLKGLMPYVFETDASLFFGKGGQTAIRLNLAYEYMFSQRLILDSSFGFNIYSKDDIKTGVGQGLSDTNFGLRLRYEIKREFAPYIGFNWAKQYGKTADLTDKKGDTVESSQFLAGLRFWF